jgi:hypothetical protein
MIGETRNVYRILIVKPLANIHLEDCGGDGRITLRWILSA